MKEKACLLMLYYITKLIVKHLKIYESSTVHSIEKKINGISEEYIPADCIWKFRNNFWSNLYF